MLTGQQYRYLPEAQAVLPPGVHFARHYCSEFSTFFPIEIAFPASTNKTKARFNPTRSKL